MVVERAAGNGHVLRQTEAFRPLFAERADRNIGGEGVGKQRVCQVLLMIGSSSSKNVAGAAPSFHASDGPAAAADILRASGAGDAGAGNPVELKSPTRLPVRPTSAAGNVQDFCPRTTPLE